MEPEERAHIEEFCRLYFEQIGAKARPEDQGTVRVTFPPRKKARFGGVRRIAFDESRRSDHVEVLEPGSPLLKAMIEDAWTAFGGVAAVYDDGRPDGTNVYTFRLELHTALQKRTGYLTVVHGPAYDEPFVMEGLPDFAFEARPAAEPTVVDTVAIQAGLDEIQGAVRRWADEFAQPGIREANKMYREAADRIRGYFDNLQEEAFRQEAKIRKRLGEIQSKLYFTEDGLREIKLEKERDRLTGQLRKIKQHNTENHDQMGDDQQQQLVRLRRRYEPKLNVTLVAVSVLTDRLAAPS